MRFASNNIVRARFKMETACLPAGEGLLPFQKAQAVVDKLSPRAICCNTRVLEKEIMSRFQK